MNEELLRTKFEKWYEENRSNETTNLKEFVYRAYQAAAEFAYNEGVGDCK